MNKVRFDSEGKVSQVTRIVRSAADRDRKPSPKVRNPGKTMLDRMDKATRAAYRSLHPARTR